MKFCSTCNDTTEQDCEAGVCTSCGHFESANADVARFEAQPQVEFNDTKVVGTTIHDAEKVSLRMQGGSKRNGGGSRPTVDTRQHTFEQGKRAVRNIAAALHIPSKIIESANNTYRLGLQNKFTNGRRIDRVAGACLYIACRLNGHPIMLMDIVQHISPIQTISSAEETYDRTTNASLANPLILGRTCIRLCRCLSINLPPILGDADSNASSSRSCNGLDPSAFLYRYASQLEFGDKVRQVSLTAVQIVRRMQKDQIHQGRHPAGIFGAALLVAARLHGFRRSRREISNVIYIGKGTVGKRVADFTKTPASELKASDFVENSDILQKIPGCNPPIFEKGRLKQDNPDEVVLQPKFLPKRPEKVKKQIEEGMFFKSLKTKKYNNDIENNIKNSDSTIINKLDKAICDKKSKKFSKNIKVEINVQECKNNFNKTQYTEEETKKPDFTKLQTQNIQKENDKLNYEINNALVTHKYKIPRTFSDEEDSCQSDIDIEANKYVITDVKEVTRNSKYQNIINREQLDAQQEKEQLKLDQEKQKLNKRGLDSNNDERNSFIKKNKIDRNLKDETTPCFDRKNFDDFIMQEEEFNDNKDSCLQQTSKKFIENELPTFDLLDDFNVDFSEDDFN